MYVLLAFLMTWLNFQCFFVAAILAIRVSIANSAPGNALETVQTLEMILGTSPRPAQILHFVLSTLAIIRGLPSSSIANLNMPFLTFLQPFCSPTFARLTHWESSSSKLQGHKVVEFKEQLLLTYKEKLERANHVCLPPTCLHPQTDSSLPSLHWYWALPLGL